MMNNFYMIGRIASEIKTKETSQGIVANFSFVYNQLGKETGEFFNCQTWGKPAETIAKWCQKGSKLAIVGRLTSNNHEGRNYVNLVVDKFEFLDTKNKNEEVKNEELPF